MRFKRTLTAVLTAGTLLCGTLSAFPVSAAYERVGVHDPSIVKLADGSYYIIGSHLAAARSDDLKNWTTTADSYLGSTKTTFFKDIYTDLAVPEAWSHSTSDYDLSGNMWAPDIIYNEVMGKYCMYLSVNGPNWNSSIVLCTADDIDGPYTYQDTIVYSGFTNNAVNHVSTTDVPRVLGDDPDISRYLVNGSWNAAYGTNAIDPAVFYDEGDNLWMVYGSWFGGIYMLELDEQTGLRDYTVQYETIANVSDAYMGKKAAGGNFASGEGPYIEYMKDPDSGRGYYYLFLSYGYFNSNGGYNMRVFRSENPDGPYVDQNGNSAVYPNGGDNIGGTVGERLMSNYQWSCNDRPYKAQGHNSVLMDDDGKLYVIYHTKFDDAYGFHEVRVHQLVMNADGWPTAAAYEYSGETLSAIGHAQAAVTGEYEFLFHTLDQKFVNEQSADVEKPKQIILHADGTVSGDVSGTWTMQSGSPEMSITFDGVTYKGAFLVQADESAAMVQRMTFTATGNNTCVWGSKKTAYNEAEDMAELMHPDSQLVYAPETVSGMGMSVRLGDTELLSGIPYYITNKFSGLLVDTEQEQAADGTNIQQWEHTSSRTQEWRVVAETDGYCRIVSMADEQKCIGVAENTANNGLNLVLQAWTGADTQLWKLVQNGSYYGIVAKSAADRAGMDVFGWSEENGGNLNQWEYWGGDCQLWRLTLVYPTVNDGVYTVRNLNSGLYLAEANANAVQSAAQGWTFQRTTDGYYTIQSLDGRALTVASAENGANMTWETLTGDISQKFTLQCCHDGSYALLTAISGGTACADVFEISTEDGANINQWEYWGGDGQKFVLEPAAVKAECICGDVNADGVFSTLDVVMMQKYLLKVGTLTDWQAGDMLEDGMIDVFDLGLMKRELLK